MKKTILATALLLFSLLLTSAAVKINEVEINPLGSDSGNEYIELYNDGAPTDISGWFVTDTLENIYFLPNITFDGFFVVDTLPELLDVQNITLYNHLGSFRDTTGIFIDLTNDPLSYSRLPDGSGDFIFKQSTKGFPNQETSIENHSVSDSCILNGDNVTLNVQVSGFCIQNVTFSVYINNSFQNFTGIKTGNNYSYTINSNQFAPSQIVDWTVYTFDCFNITQNNGNENFYVNSLTTLSISPSNPDGNSNWYITEPHFTLTNPDATAIYYQWDSQSYLNYTSTFGLEDAPNNANITAGVLDLNYNSNVCNESQNTVIIYTDFTDPQFNNLLPQPNSTNYNAKPNIQAHIDELYGSNSGINLNTLSVFLDDILISATITDDELDADINFTPQNDLSLGTHKVTINATDEAGRNSIFSWYFTINSTTDFNLTIYSPKNISYPSRSIPINLTTSKPVSKIELLDLNQRIKTFLLCKNCDDYGYFTKKVKSLDEGANNLIIRATDQFGNTHEENISIFIDSKSPRIIKTAPKRNSASNGSIFLVKYSEENLKSVKLFVANKTVDLNCTSGINKECSTDIDLSEFNGQKINYYFTISDEFRNISSRNTTIFIDTVKPNLTVISPTTNSSSQVTFNIQISEKVTLDYIDNSSSQARWVRLCSNCDSLNSKKRFSMGEHNITFRATDKVLNTDIETITLQII